MRTEVMVAFVLYRVVETSVHSNSFEDLENSPTKIVSDFGLACFLAHIV